MDINILEKSPQMSSLLVKLYDSQRLYGYARDNSPEARRELSSVMASLLEHKLSTREQELVADVLITLIRQAESDLRQALAEKLARMEQVPLRLVLHLVNDEISVAGPMLRHSPILSDQDLIYIIKSRSAIYWQAIAARKELNEDIIKMLVNTRERGTVLALAENADISLPSDTMETLATLAIDMDELAQPLLYRKEMPSSLARKLYAYVGDELKSYIKSFYGYVPDELARAADDLILEFTDAPRPSSVPQDEFVPTEAMMIQFGALQERGGLNLTGVMNTLKKSSIAAFVGMFALYTGLNLETIGSILREANGFKLAVLCRSISLQKGDFSSIYLITHRMRSDDRLVNHRDMMAALDYFDRVKPDVARQVLQRGRSVH